MNDIPIACNLGVFTEAERARHREVSDQWHNAIQEAVNIPTGYAFRFEADPQMIQLLAEFISRERLCCPFFHFEIVLEPDGPLWLHLMGDERVKAFLDHEIKALL